MFKRQPKLHSAPSAGIEIKRGVRADKPFAVDAHDGAGNLSRHSFGTAAEARATAKRMAKNSGWPIRDQL